MSSSRQIPFSLFVSVPGFLGLAIDHIGSLLIMVQIPADVFRSMLFMIYLLHLADLNLLQIHREEGCSRLTSDQNRKQNWPKNGTKW